MKITLTVAPEVALFYTRVAAATGRTPAEAMEDALFLLAAELSLEALNKNSTEKDPSL